MAKPNIVFILADDYGLDCVGCYGSDRFKGKTPNIDALARTGIRFENAYCTPLCGPTRCLLHTGRYGFRTGGNNNQNAHTPSSKAEPSLARTLKQAGYVTDMAGKWRQMGESPGEWGFDEFITEPLTVAASMRSVVTVKAIGFGGFGCRCARGDSRLKSELTTCGWTAPASR